MDNHHEHAPVNIEDAAGSPDEREPWSRREFLGLGAVAAAGLITPGALWLPEAGAVAAASSFSGSKALRLAMHVHASWSEGMASWEAQFAQASSTGIDVLYMTDHDFRATASNYITSLPNTNWVKSTTGALAQQASTTGAGGFRLLAESSSTSAAASVTLALQADPLAKNRVRTSIAGQTLEHTVTTAALSGGATYELAIQLSYHPAASGRPAGAYRLIYRFGAASASRFTENGGLTGVVAAPTPAAGSVQRLSPETDVAAIWPTMTAMDNGMFGVSFSAKSPRKGAVADVKVTGVRFLRTQSSPASVTANQARLITTYQPLFPNLAVRAGTELGDPLPHMNPFGIPQYFPNYATLPTNSDQLFAAIVADVHSKHGIISLNHPFGFQEGPLLSAAARDAKRRQLFGQLQAIHDYGVDIMEVGYTLRGQVDTATHVALYDTFARNGTFITANGTNDDHGGQFWKGIKNGFFTGAWATTRSDADIVAAMSAGRAYTAHLGKWPGAEIDLLVDGTVPMGHVSVATKATRSLSIWAPNLPAGSSVQLVSGPVDFAGAQDPGTTVVRTFAPSAFTGSIATLTVDTSTSRFYRVQVLASDASWIGVGNPVWLLRAQPPGGIPPARA
jgi:hypothetical protein